MAVAPDLTQISVTWDQPAALNGIVSYIISIVGMDLATQITVLNEISDAVIETQYSFDVEEYAVYVVMVTAMTGGGLGPTVETNFTTPEGGMHITHIFQIHIFVPIISDTSKQ